MPALRCDAYQLLRVMPNDCLTQLLTYMYFSTWLGETETCQEETIQAPLYSAAEFLKLLETFSRKIVLSDFFLFFPELTSTSRTPAKTTIAKQNNGKLCFYTAVWRRNCR